MVQEGWGRLGQEQTQHNREGNGGKEPFWAAGPALKKKTSKICAPGECAWQEKRTASDKKRMVGGLGSGGSTCHASNGARRSCGRPRHYSGVPRRR